MTNTAEETSGHGGRVLIVDDENSARSALSMLLADDGYEVRDAPDGFKAVGIMKEWTPDILLTDLRMPLMDGIELLKRTQKDFPDVICVVMTAFASVDTAVEAMKLGARDYLTKPLNFDAVELVLQRSIERLHMQREIQSLREQLEQKRPQSEMLGSSPAMQKLVALIDQVAPSRATVLVTGESGTGKELIARMLHDRSPRQSKPFVPLHCAALPETLLEAELFGHEKGAFTGASGRRQGRFEEADGGTLFLDEVGEIPLPTQVKLLRVLQERSVQRLGDNKSIDVDVRIVAATNRDLKQEVEEGNFREDLFYRLHVINLHAPPLRQRRSDIALLATHFAAHYAQENAKAIESIAPEAMAILESYHWPGNVRELQNLLERAVVLCRGTELESEHFPEELLALSPERESSSTSSISIPGSTLAEIERHAILETFEATGGSTRETAELLGISQRKVQYKLRDFEEEDGSGA